MKSNNILFCIMFLLSSCSLKRQNEKLNAILNIPSFRILSLDSSQCISSDNISGGSPVIFVYFSPDCEHCQSITSSIVSNKKYFKKAKIYFITNDAAEEASKFSRIYNLSDEKNIFVGRDYEFSFYSKFIPPATPFLAIYNDKRKLVKIYNEEVGIHSLITSIQ